MTLSLLFLPLILPAQISSNRNKIILYTGDTLQLDTLSILPGSLSIWSAASVLDSNLFEYDWMRSTLLFLAHPGSDTLTVTYKTIPFKLPTSYYMTRLSPLNFSTLTVS